MLIFLLLPLTGASPKPNYACCPAVCSLPAQMAHPVMQRRHPQQPPPGGGALLGGQNGALWTILPAVTHADLTVIILAATWSKGLGEANLAGSPNEPHFFSPQKTQGGSQGSPPWFRKVGGAGSRILGGVLGVGWGGAGPCGRWVGTLCLTHLPMQG